MKKLIILIAMLMASSAWADWTWFANQKTDDTQFYLDLETIKSNKDVVYVWTMYDQKEPDVGAPRPTLSMAQYNEIHCGTPQSLRRIVYRTYLTSMAEGSPDDTWTVEDAEMRYPYPGSVLEELISVACVFANSD
jgi:hypothetical protein